MMLFAVLSAATVASSEVLLYQDSFDGIDVSVSQMLEGLTYEDRDPSEAPLKPSGFRMPWLFACGAFVGGPREIKGLYDSGELQGVASCNFASPEAAGEAAADAAASATAVAKVEQGTSELTLELVARIDEQLFELDRVAALSVELRKQLLSMKEQLQVMNQMQELIRMSEQLMAVKELIPTGGPASAPSELAQPSLKEYPPQGVPLSLPALAGLPGLLEAPPSFARADVFAPQASELQSIADLQGVGQVYSPYPQVAYPQADAGLAGVFAAQATPAAYPPQVYPQAQVGVEGVSYLPVQQLPLQYAPMVDYAPQVGVAGVNYLPVEQLPPQYAPMIGYAPPAHLGQPPLLLENVPPLW